MATAVETRAQAEKLVRVAVEGKLAANAQIVGPVISAFWHLGEFGTGEEWQVLFKTLMSKFDQLEASCFRSTLGTTQRSWRSRSLLAPRAV